jgi:hypothetical protein
VSAELEVGQAQPPVDWVPRSAQAPAGSTAANTEADPVASRIGRHGVAGVSEKAREKA